MRSVSIVTLVWTLLTANASAQAEPLAPLPDQPPGTAWPTEQWPTGDPGPDVDAPALEEAARAIFAPTGRAGVPETRALLVVQGGRIVLERYAEGFDADTRFHSWSMAKSVTGALVALLVARGDLALDEPVPLEAWRGEDDPRGAITVRQLLQMSSGLDNGDGGSDPTAFVARLLFGDLSDDMARNAARADLLHEPGTHWAYSTATSILLARVVGDQVGGTPDAMLGFMRRELFDPLGVQSFVPEFDAAGTFIGGGMTWADARDWARLGLLFLRDGMWDGRRLLPEGWIDFARTPAPAANNGNYGAHFWLNVPAKEGQFKMISGGPPSAFFLTGNNGQYVALLPDRDLIVVRLGELQSGDYRTLMDMIWDVASAFPASVEAPP